jgi:single-strand DNA-binding protein
MASFNKVILIGNMTADPELKQTQSGTSVCTFDIAVNRRFKQDGVNVCDFLTIVAWSQRAEFVCQWFKKGDPILICGQIQTRNWTDKNGNKRVTVEINADEVSFVTSAPQSVANDVTHQQTPPDPRQWGNKSYTPEAYTQGSMTFSAPASQQFEEIPNDEGLPF